MPELDVSFVLDDPMFSDLCSIIRRSGGVTSKGRANPVKFWRFDNVGCVVTQEEPDELDRKPDGEMAPRRINVFSQTPMYGPVIDPLVADDTQEPIVLPQPPLGVPYQPDLILWNGTCYIVTQVLPYSRYGSGFYEVKAESIEMPDVTQ
jgi:hypothetical protein